MGKKILNPWLADCVWHELAAVTTWKREINTGIKADPETRFEDDGSNFRSRVSGQEQYLVQLIEVLSAVEPVKAILSDGVTKIKAQLSGDVVQLLETELAEDFSSEVTGDVFQLRNFTVVSTIFGPADDFVQLAVDEVEYEHHLRKTQGQPRPIEEDEHIRFLIEDITQLRCPPNLEDQTFVDRSGIGTSTDHAGEHISTLVPSTQSQFLQSGIQSQYPASRKRLTEPTLSNEGFQIAEGLNLNKPLRAAPGSPASKGPSAVKTEKTSLLLGLLGPNPAAPESLLPALDAPANGRKRAREVSPPASLLPVEIPVHQPQKSSAIVAETPAKVNANSVKILSDSDPEPEERTVSQRPQLAPAASNRSPPSAQPPPQVLSVKSSGSSGQPKIPYGRRKIPANQQKLLDDRSCWIPSQPGYRFPEPNVPIDLLKKWNKTATPSPQKPQISQASYTRNYSQRAESPLDVTMDGDDAQSTSDSTDMSIDSDEEFDSDEWPASPSQRRPELPPDSSWENDNVLQGTQHDDLEVAVPRALPIRKSPSAAPGRPVQPPVRHALPPRPPVSMHSQATVYDISPPLATRKGVSQRSLPPDSPVRASQPASSMPTTQSRHGHSAREAVQGTPAQPEISPRSAGMVSQGSRGSGIRSQQPAMLRQGEVAVAPDTISPARPVPGSQRLVPQDSPSSNSLRQRAVNDRDLQEPDFDIDTLAIPQLRRLLIAHDIPFSPSAKRDQLIKLFKSVVALRDRVPPGVDARRSNGLTSRASDQDSPVQPRTVQESTHGSSSSEARALSQQEQLLQQSIAKERLKIAELEQRKRERKEGRMNEASGHIRTPVDTSVEDSTSPYAAASEESSPPSTFRNPAMVGRKPPIAQSSPLATPLRKQPTVLNQVNGSQDVMQSSCALHQDDRPNPRPSPTILTGASASPDHQSATFAEVNSSWNVPRASLTPRNATGLEKGVASSAPSNAQQSRRPDDAYRLARREHFGRSGRREKWINDNFERVKHGNKTVESMFDLYKAQHPQDTVTDLEQITRAAQIVFRSSREALAGTKFRRINLPAEPVQRAAPREQTSSARPPSRQQQVSQRSRDNMLPAQLDGTSERRASAPSPRGGRRAADPPITQIDGANDQANSTATPKLKSTRADNTNRSSLDERVAETLMNDSTSNPLKEFCRNWLSIKPGGAFAAPQPATRKVRRTVDVLQWDI